MTAGRRVCLLAAAASLICATPLRIARAQETTGRNWVLEHFADDVTILRTTIPLPHASARAGLTLSCEGAEQRLRLALPEAAARALGAAANGQLLCRGAGAGPGDPFVVAGFGRPDPATLVLAGDGRDASGGSVVALARLLVRRPGGLDCLIDGGQRVVSLRDLLAYHLPLPTSPQDALALHEFVDACSRAVPDGTERRSPRANAPRSRP